MTTDTATRPTTTALQLATSVKEAMQQERLAILRIVSSYPQTNPEVARAINCIRMEILGRNR